MTKAQFLFGMAVGAMLATSGTALYAAGITGGALSGTGLLVLLVNVVYWTLERRASASGNSPALARVGNAGGRSTAARGGVA
ncbi:hypothetical protein [Microbulbifer sediminum]|uniref:hypothetical protein n=1 Tax=Microbulbifer sediminum TaxID=2904250 RepID=UPI001F297D42|nr:hypothetical protein [Microbulbifer sediminum]